MTGQNLNKEIIDSWCVHVYEVLQQLNTIFFFFANFRNLATLKLVTTHRAL